MRIHLRTRASVGAHNSAVADTRIRIRIRIRSEKRIRRGASAAARRTPDQHGARSRSQHWPRPGGWLDAVRPTGPAPGPRPAQDCRWRGTGHQNRVTQSSLTPVPDPPAEPSPVVVDLYRMVGEMADRVSARRGTANAFFLGCGSSEGTN
ncbi:RipA family octameric membrane protein [Streptomyces shenzhenensis]|uniref:RipA family octameric membrane protein n=1 Tax=Streptomyces shenzhenensis TaxID=943815 RepID=UPI003D9C5F8B